MVRAWRVECWVDLWQQELWLLVGRAWECDGCGIVREHWQDLPIRISDFNFKFQIDRMSETAAALAMQNIVLLPNSLDFRLNTATLPPNSEFTLDKQTLDAVNAFPLNVSFHTEDFRSHLAKWIEEPLDLSETSAESRSNGLSDQVVVSVEQDLPDTPMRQPKRTDTTTSTIQKKHDSGPAVLPKSKNSNRLFIFMQTS